MTYEELKAAYEAAVQKCSELEKENDELKKSNEDQALHIEHLEEQILKRNKMLFGQKSEKSKFIVTANQTSGQKNEPRSTSAQIPHSVHHNELQ